MFFKPRNIFPGYNGIKLGINNKKCFWKIFNMVTHYIIHFFNVYVMDKIKEILKYFDMDKSENI